MDVLRFNHANYPTNGNKTSQTLKRIAAIISVSYYVSMATPQALLMSFNDYQTQLANVNVAISGGNWATAYTALAKAQVILAGMPVEIITAQQTTRMRLTSELKAIADAITLAKAGGTGMGLFGIVRTR